MELITIEERMSYFGGVGSVEDIIAYMNSTGIKSWSSSSLDDIMGFSNSTFSSGGYYGSNGGFFGSNGDNDSNGDYSSNGGGSSGDNNNFDGGTRKISIQIDGGGSYLIDSNIYLSESNVAYREVSFDGGSTWQPEAMEINPIVPATGGHLSTTSAPGVSINTMYLSPLDAYNFLNDMGTGAGYVAEASGVLAFTPYTEIAGSFIGGITALESFKWGDIERDYMNNGNEQGLIIEKQTINMPNFPTPYTTYVISSITGERFGTVSRPGY